VPVVVVFASQKGGVGKSTLARALATFAVRAGLKTRIADLDAQQKTVVVWEQSRQLHNVRPPISVDAFADAAQGLASAAGEDLLILDTPGHVTDGTTHLAQWSHLLVQPTSPSADDLPISVFVFQALERVGIEREKLAFALCRVLSTREERMARSHLAGFGYTVLKGAIPEHLTYRKAMKTGRSISETRKRAFNARAEVLIADLLEKAMANAGRPGRKQVRKLFSRR